MRTQTIEAIKRTERSTGAECVSVRWHEVTARPVRNWSLATFFGACRDAAVIQEGGNHG